MKHLSFKNKIFTKKELKKVLYETFTEYGLTQASQLADQLKTLGFRYATKAGISISVEDLKITPNKEEILNQATQTISEANDLFNRGEISSIERFQTIINVWNDTSESIKNSLVEYFRQTDPLNSIYLMAFSGARGNLSQVRQLVGMRGLMADPNGQIMDIPIIHNFREGLTITDYIMSSYGARKGVVDTALKTADSGYLTRRLVDVAQDVIIREYNCHTKRGVRFSFSVNVDRNALANKIVGRTCAKTVTIDSAATLQEVLKSNSVITKASALSIARQPEISALYLRSPLTCESLRSVCQLCYGWNLASGALVDLGDAIGIIAAQSIGEPGTQLTMRTFHTGGIFTVDPSRQIRAQFSSLLTFPSDLKFRWGRTIYGKTIKIVEQTLQLTLITYSNVCSNVTVSPNTSLFIDAQSFVKSGDLIAELPLSDQQTVKAKKTIVAPISGQIVPNFKNEVIWILQGTVYDLPYQSLINVSSFFSASPSLNHLHFLASMKLSARTNGWVNIKDAFSTTPLMQIINGLAYSDTLPLFDINRQNFIFLCKTLDLLECSVEYCKTSRRQFLFRSKLSGAFLVPTGGQLFQGLNTGFVGEKNSRLLYIAEEIYPVNRDRSLLLVEPFSELGDVGVELIKGTYSKTAGFLQIVESNGILNEVSIKPGKFFEYSKLTEQEFVYLQSLHNKLYYPGEILFNDIQIENLSLVEFINLELSAGLLIRPVFDFNIRKFSKCDDFIFSHDLQVSSLQKTLKIQESHNILRSNKGFSLVNIELRLNFEDDCKLRIFKVGMSEYTVSTICEDIISVNSIIPKQLQLAPLKFALNVHLRQYVEKHNIIGRLYLVFKNELFKNLQEARFQFDDTRKILFLTNTDFKTFYSEKPIFNFLESDFVKYGDQLSLAVNVLNSGQVINASNPFILNLRLGVPIFFKEGMVMLKNGFIRKFDSLGVITYDQIITGDIVQGLPKVEEILEARRPQTSAILAVTPGIVKNINIVEKQTSTVLLSHTSGEKVYVLNKKKTNYELIVSKNDYIALGQPLTSGSVSPHDLLETFFNFYKIFNSNYDSVYLSFKNLQILLINKIQQVYSSQGVDIADKHLEIIVRQITAKVRVTNPGSTLLVQGEILDLQQVSYINSIMERSCRKLASYSPLLLGITKSSLLTDSFISAASFQETTKILTAAAIEGKVDWLRGLKENVIIGRLIPVGKGFSYQENFGHKALTFY